MVNEILTETFGEVLGNIILIAGVVLSVAVVPLLAWAGTRLTFKIVNRGVGK